MTRWVVRAVYVIVGLMAFSTLTFAVFKPIKVLPRIGLSPGILLTDQDGQSLSSDSLRGKIVLYSFGYSGCTTPCKVGETHSVMGGAAARHAVRFAIAFRGCGRSRSVPAP